MAGLILLKILAPDIAAQTFEHILTEAGESLVQYMLHPSMVGTVA
jgi:hypothetical protein